MKSIRVSNGGITWVSENGDTVCAVSLKTKFAEVTAIAKQKVDSPYGYRSTWVARVVAETYLPGDEG